MKTKNKQIWKAGYHGLACLLFLLLNSCAIPMAPTGGPKDVEAPKVVGANPENFSKNQNIQKVSITFNEFIELNNPQQEIIITPSLKEFPEFSIKRKTLIVDFQENKLSENTTYSIQFGNAIKDITEGNILRDLNFVFSTGSYIDSLFIAGTTVSASTGQPQKGVKVMLYRSITDSAVYKKKPEYFARTNENGRFSINNLPKDSFYVFGINDKNENYLVDGDEEVAFYPDKIKTDTGALVQELNLQLYLPESDIPEIKRYIFLPPHFSVRFAKKADSLSVFQVKNNKLLPLKYLKISPDKDSVIGWVDNLADTSGIKLHINLDNTKIDTLIRPDKNVRISLQPNILLQSGAEVFNTYDAPVALSFNLPVSRVTLDKILIYKDDTVKIKLTSARFTDSTRIMSLLNWDYKAGVNYRLMFLPGAVQTIYGSTNDSMEALASIPDRRKFGSVSINVTVDTQSFYIFQLVNEAGNITFNKRLSKSQVISIPYLEPGNYRMRLVEDKNRNGRWDPGSIVTEKQPEKIFYNPEELRVKANWEMTDLKFELAKIKK